MSTKISPKQVEEIANYVENIGKRLRAGGNQSLSDGTYKYFADEIRCQFGNGCRCGECKNLNEYECEVGLGATPKRNLPTDRHPYGCSGFKRKK